MLHALLKVAHTLLIQPSCPICRSCIDDRVPPTTTPGGVVHPCDDCIESYGLGPFNPVGDTPLPWKALGNYEGRFRKLVLKVKHQPQGRCCSALIQLLAQQHVPPPDALLVPIPSWKRKRPNPLPKLIAEGLGRPNTMLLRRTRAGLGQHHLNRTKRMRNLQGSFQAATLPPTSLESQRELWLIDDILTTGATALAARHALHQAGHRVGGVICLARTPTNRHGR